MKKLAFAGLVALSLTACVTTPKPPRTCEAVIVEFVEANAKAGRGLAVNDVTADGSAIIVFVDSANGDKDAMLIKFAPQEDTGQGAFKFQETCNLIDKPASVYRAVIRGRKVSSK